MPRFWALFAFAAPAVFAASPSFRGESTRMHRRAQTDGDGYAYIGCYLDNTEDRVLGLKQKSSEMTAEVCVSHCRRYGATYMATQFGHECWCSNDNDLKYERHSSAATGTECDVQCEGDTSEICGGSEAFSLYSVAEPTESTSTEYMGCYGDEKEDRVMGNLYATADMTEGVCRTHCEGKGAMYYGTQFGNECWCGISTVFEDYQVNGPAVCAAPCAGNPMLACGGRDAFSLYRFIDQEEPTTPVTPVPPTSPCKPTRKN